MPAPRPVRLATQRLAADVLGAAADPRLPELVGWLAGSPRFEAFAEAHHGKIRRKVRGARDEAAWRDVRAELLVARLLLADRRFELVMEPHGTGKGGSDFGVTFRGTDRFDLEVTRRRGVPDVGTLGALILGKLRQLRPSVPNALLFLLEDAAPDDVDVPAAIRLLRSRADAKDDAFFAFRGIDGAKGFYERFLRLGGMYAWSEGADAGAAATLWRNPSARIALPGRAAAAILACLRAPG